MIQERTGFTISTLLLILLLQLPAKAQYEILTLDGKSLVTGHYEIIAEENLILYTNKKDKIKELERDFVFSISDAAGNIQIFYTPDSLSYNYTVDEMYDYMYGADNARNNYKAPWHAVSGFGLATTAVFALPALGVNYFYAPLFSLGHIGVAGAAEPKSKKLGLPENSSAPYKSGYIHEVRRKRVKNAAIGGAAGIAFGYLIISVVNMQN